MIYSTVTPVAHLTAPLRLDMFRLFERYYDNASWERFQADLAEKDDIFVFRDERVLVGFTTLMLRRFPDLGPATFLFTGDTVIHEAYWGGRFLQAQFFRYIVKAKASTPRHPLYWMLISKGYKTYMMMRRNFPRSYPNVTEAPPPEMQRAMHGFYTQKFGTSYDPDANLVRHAEPLDAVTGRLAEPDADARANPEVAYFLRANPGYASGDELACIAEIRKRDFARHISKYVLRPPRLVRRNARGTP